MALYWLSSRTWKRTSMQTTIIARARKGFAASAQMKDHLGLLLRFARRTLLDRSRPTYLRQSRPSQNERSPQPTSMTSSRASTYRSIVDHFQARMAPTLPAPLVPPARYRPSQYSAGVGNEDFARSADISTPLRANVGIKPPAQIFAFASHGGGAFHLNSL